MRRLIYILLTLIVPVTALGQWNSGRWEGLYSAPNLVEIGMAGTGTIGIRYSYLYFYTASGYINFTSTTGSGGYGLRDNSGTVQFKNSGGSWDNIAGASPGGGGWTDDGSIVRLTSASDSVGIGTVSPAAFLHVVSPNVGSSRGFIVDGDAESGDIPFVVRTNIDPASASDSDTRFIVSYEGYVGIGTLTPSSELTIIDASDGADICLFGVDNQDYGIYLTEGTVFNTYGARLLFDGTNNWFTIQTGEGTLTNRLTIPRATGYVGVDGTTAPQHPLSDYSSDPAWCLTDTDINLKYDSAVQAADSAAVHIYVDTNPVIAVKQAAGYNQRLKYAFEGWCTHDAATDTITLGNIPANAIVTTLYVWVQEAFNSDGNDLLEIGYDADPDAYGTSLDLSSTGVKSMTLGATSKTVDATNRPIKVYYDDAGSDATTGEVHVVVEWYQATVNP